MSDFSLKWKRFEDQVKEARKMGKCDADGCLNNAIWECGKIQDKETRKIRMARWCEKHCPKRVTEK